MSDWKDISEAPKDKPFLALNHDGEIWVAKYDEDGRLYYRHSCRHEPRKWEVVVYDGEEYLREDKEFAARNEKWEANWVIWSRLFEFRPTHWSKLPDPLIKQEVRG